MPLDMYAKWIDKATKRIADVSAIRQAWPFVSDHRTTPLIGRSVHARLGGILFT